MIDHGKRNLIGVMVDVVDYEGVVRRVVDAARTRRRLGVSALAVHGVMTGFFDEGHRYRLNSLDLACPDGQPVRWALHWLHGAALPDRVYGPDLTLRLCAEAARLSLPIYLYGNRPEVLTLLQSHLLERFPGLIVAGAEPSRFGALPGEEKVALVRRITESGARLVFVGLGCPRQEVWAFEYRDHLSMPIVAVGAAFDFHSGLSKQAPAFLQRAGLEWLFRLLHEPRRLWRRYLLLSPLYVLLVLAQILRLRRFTQPPAPPGRELGYG